MSTSLEIAEENLRLLRKNCPLLKWTLNISNGNYCSYESSAITNIHDLINEVFPPCLWLYIDLVYIKENIHRITLHRCEDFHLDFDNWFPIDIDFSQYAALSYQLLAQLNVRIWEINSKEIILSKNFTLFPQFIINLIKRRGASMCISLSDVYLIYDQMCKSYPLIYPNLELIKLNLNLFFTQEYRQIVNIIFTGTTMKFNLRYFNDSLGDKISSYFGSYLLDSLIFTVPNFENGYLNKWDRKIKYPIFKMIDLILNPYILESGIIDIIICYVYN